VKKVLTHVEKSIKLDQEEFLRKLKGKAIDKSFSFKQMSYDWPSQPRIIPMKFTKFKTLVAAIE
jgi:hypothetical protein